MPSNKNFGVTFFLVFLIVSIIFYFYNFSFFYYTTTILIGLIFLIISFSKPKILQPLNLIWYKFSILLSKIITPIIMLILYTIMFIPIGFYKKIFTKNYLGIKFEKNKDSYWSKTVLNINFDKQF